MKEWKEVKLGELIEIKYGKDHKKLSDGKIPCIGSGGVMRYVNSFLYDEVSILIPRKGSLNNIIFRDKPFWTVDTMFWSKINDEIVEPKFLYYQLTLIDYTNLNVGSAVPSLTVPVINDIDISLPPLPEQKAIAEILSSLDDKIDLLNRQNKTLDQMAETLFRQWFIEEAKEDWEEGKLEELCLKINSGGTPSTKIEEYYNGEISWYATKELKDNFLFGSISKITEKGLQNSSAKLFPKGTVIIAIYASPTVGRLGILGTDATFNQATCGLIPNEELCCKEFLYLFLKSERDNLNSMASGSAQQNLNVGKIKSYPIFIPDKITMEKFKNLVKLQFNKIEQNQIQIYSLENLHDTLLPKLMSGEVRVEMN